MPDRSSGIVHGMAIFEKAGISGPYNMNFWIINIC
jgi:hypothetical protein